MKPNKLINYALSYVAREAQFIEDEIQDEINLSKEELDAAIKDIKENYVLVPVDDPGLRMVEKEITL